VTGRLDTDTVARARAVRIADEVQRRRIPLRRAGHELVGACPVCGDGGKGSRSDRFAVHIAKNAWLCRQCQKGGGIVDLVMHLDSVGFADAVSRLTNGVRHAPVPQRTPAPQPEPSQDYGRQQALALWEQAVPIGGTIAEQYLRAPKLQGGRAIDLSSDLLPPDLSPRVLRFHPRVYFSEKVSFGPAWHPCLLALYRKIEPPIFVPDTQLVECEPCAVMRTALTSDGCKIGRAALGSIDNAAIKLNDDADVTMGLTIGEGLETTLAGMMFGFMPAWALGSAGGIAKFPVLSGIEALTILAETDKTNERAIRKCFARWNAAGREVYRATPEAGGDANDAWTVDVA